MDRLDILHNGFDYIGKTVDVHDTDRVVAFMEPLVERYFQGVIRDIAITDTTGTHYIRSMEVDIVIPSGQLLEPYFGSAQSTLAVGIQDMLGSGVLQITPNALGNYLTYLEIDEPTGVSGFIAGDNLIFRTTYTCSAAGATVITRDRTRKTNIKQEVDLFGTEFIEESDQGQVTVGAGDPSTIISMIISVPVDGAYRIEWQTEWGAERFDTLGLPYFLVTLDNEPSPGDDEDDDSVLMWSRMVDSSTINVNGGRYTLNGFAHRTLSEGDHEVYFMVGGGTYDVDVRKMRVQAWRTDR